VEKSSGSRKPKEKNQETRIRKTRYNPKGRDSKPGKMNLPSNSKREKRDHFNKRERGEGGDGAGPYLRYPDLSLGTR